MLDFITPHMENMPIQYSVIVNVLKTEVFFDENLYYFCLKHSLRVLIRETVLTCTLNLSLGAEI